MVAAKWFQFAEAEVPSAKNPDVLVAIPAGVHLVIFDEVVSRAGGDPECEIGFGGPSGLKPRILRSTLVELCENHHAVFFE